MTVRTDKIQALTGSAPLTLPKTLPTAKKNVKVDTSGNITTPSTSVNFSSLGASGETGWVLLGVSQTLQWSNGCYVSIEGSGYQGSDIYMYKLDFDMESSRNSAYSNGLMIAPYSGNTNISNGSFQSEGYYNHSNSTGNGPYNTGAQLGVLNGYEMYMCDSVNGNSSTTYDYDSMFDPAGGNENYAYRGGCRGSIRYYNGRAIRAPLLDPQGFAIEEYNPSYYNSSQAYITQQFYKKGNQLFSSSAFPNDYADKFRLFNGAYAADNGGAGNPNYFWRGYIALYGIPKTG